MPCSRFSGLGDFSHFRAKLEQPGVLIAILGVQARILGLEGGHPFLQTQQNGIAAQGRQHIGRRTLHGNQLGFRYQPLRFSRGHVVADVHQAGKDDALRLVNADQADILLHRQHVLLAGFQSFPQVTQLPSQPIRYLLRRSVILAEVVLYVIGNQGVTNVRGKLRIARGVA